MKKIFNQITASKYWKGIVVGTALVFGTLLFLDTFGVVSAVGTRYTSAIDGGGGGEVEYANTRIPEVTSQQPTTITAQYVNTTGSTVQGKYTTTIQVTESLAYAWNRWLNNPLHPSSDTATGGYAPALGQPNITIGYDVRVLDAGNSQEITDGNVSVGQHIVLKFMPYVSDNIFWFGTGYSSDSPYGDWSADASAPARVGSRVTCLSKDFTVNYSTLSLKLDVYIPFQVHPPQRSIVPTTLSGLSCDALAAQTDGSQTMRCTVNGTGTMTPTFRFDSTFGKFYYRYYDYRDSGGQFGGNGCYGNNIPLTAGNSVTSGSALRPAFVVTIPVKEIPVTLTASDGETPTTPIITSGGAACSVVVKADQDIELTLVSTDPGGLQLHYGVDWDTANNAKEVTSGWTPYVPSGTPQSLKKVGGYATPGTYVIYGVSQNTSGKYSGWGSCTVIVGAAQCADGIDNDGDGKIDYPGDTDCSGSGDNSEVGAPPAQCADGIDNNGDGTVDYPNDPTCSAADDTLEGASVPELTLRATPPLIKKGQACTIELSAENVTSCSLSGPDVTQTFTPTDGSVRVTRVVTPALSESSTYRLACSSLSGSTVSKTVNCKIAPTFEEI